MLIPEKVVKVGTSWDRIKLYYNRHPVICGYAALSSAIFCVVMYNQYHVDKRMQCVAKYRRNYTVLRPDDPQTAMIKTKRIGLDY
ncbi:hypothetical protein KQX54_001795 [Cotesia glomerata]|uniref:Uncharacterized protein n=1 Tax=Cotesia glomerata TaxID=32391 RepID=A0AAV7ISN4_COTGL|nr:hypothetical protein KQX54_001795 [Cotesia glomerata]